MDRQGEAALELARIVERQTDIAGRGGPEQQTRLDVMGALIDSQLTEIKRLRDEQNRLFEKQFKLLRDLDEL